MERLRNSWLPRFRVLILLSMALGCNDRSVTPTSSAGKGPPTTALSWAEQIAAVRAGDQTAIRIAVSQPSEIDWSALSVDCEGLRSLWVEGSKPSTPQQWQAISELQHLEALAITADVNAADFAAISRCPQLRRLNLPSCSFGGQAFRSLNQLRALEQLRLGAPQIGDSGFHPIYDLQNLKYLHLIDVPISNETLLTLGSIQTLESLYLDGGNTTIEGQQELLKMRPDLHFHLNQLHLPTDPMANHDK